MALGELLLVMISDFIIYFNNHKLDLIILKQPEILHLNNSVALPYNHTIIFNMEQ
jgi:hypothetical protein